MKEEWKDIPGWNGRFQVSNFGQVRTIYKSKRFKPYLHQFEKAQYGYLKVCLCYKGNRKTWRLHDLVASVWIRPLNKNEVVHHKNHLKCCNCISNL